MTTASILWVDLRLCRGRPVAVSGLVHHHFSNVG